MFFKKHKAFTLIEMVIVLFIISLLMLLVLPNVSKQRRNAEVKTNDALVTTVETQATLYEEDTGHPPATLADLNDEYLSDRQLKQANEAQITIKDGVVSRSGK
ncbi:competence type IV pilus major pilin ComGC [Lactobacillus selangorensis]